MSIEFDELAKLRESPADDAQSELTISLLDYILKQLCTSHVLIHQTCLTDMVDFTDEEGYGKYLDLHKCFEQFLNLKGIDVSVYHLIYDIDIVGLG